MLCIKFVFLFFASYDMCLIWLMLRRAVAPDVAWSRQECWIGCRCWCKNGRWWLVWDNSSFFDIPAGLGTDTSCCSGRLLSPTLCRNLQKLLSNFHSEVKMSKLFSMWRRSLFQLPTTGLMILLSNFFNDSHFILERTNSLGTSCENNNEQKNCLMLPFFTYLVLVDVHR